MSDRANAALTRILRSVDRVRLGRVFVPEAAAFDAGLAGSTIKRRLRVAGYATCAEQSGASVPHSWRGVWVLTERGEAAIREFVA